jgi:hypothetical protein
MGNRFPAVREVLENYCILGNWQRARENRLDAAELVGGSALAADAPSAHATSNDASVSRLPRALARYLDLSQRVHPASARPLLKQRLHRQGIAW